MTDFSLAGNLISWQSTEDVRAHVFLMLILSACLLSQCTATQSRTDPKRKHGSRSYEAHCLCLSPKTVTPRRAMSYLTPHLTTPSTCTPSSFSTQPSSSAVPQLLSGCLPCADPQRPLSGALAEPPSLTYKAPLQKPLSVSQLSQCFSGRSARRLGFLAGLVSSCPWPLDVTPLDQPYSCVASLCLVATCWHAEKCVTPFFQGAMEQAELLGLGAPWNARGHMLTSATTTTTSSPSPPAAPAPSSASVHAGPHGKREEGGVRRRRGGVTCGMLLVWYRFKSMCVLRNPHAEETVPGLISRETQLW